MLRPHRGLKALTTAVCPSVCLSVYDQIEKVTARARHPRQIYGIGRLRADCPSAQEACTPCPYGRCRFGVVHDPRLLVDRSRGSSGSGLLSDKLSTSHFLDHSCDLHEPRDGVAEQFRGGTRPLRRYRVLPTSADVTKTNEDARSTEQDWFSWIFRRNFLQPIIRRPTLTGSGSTWSHVLYRLSVRPAICRDAASYNSGGSETRVLRPCDEN